MTEDFYDLLEIPSDASQDEIKEAYREKVRVYHPDLNDDDRAQAQFTAVKKAYDILGDPVERQAYDRLGHEDYVAKRTSGLPAPDVWQSDDGAASTDDSDDASTGDDSTASTTASGTGTSTRSRTRSDAGGATGTGATAGAGAASTAEAEGSTSRTASDATKDRTASTTTGGTGNATTDGTATGGRGVGSTDGGTAHAGTRSRSGRNVGRFGDSALVRWWRRQNFAWPLIWLSVLTYLAGLAHYLESNLDAVQLVWADLTAIGAEPAELWDAVTTQRYGIQSPFEFVAAVELVDPPLPPTEWYGLLAGVVVGAFALLGLVRIGWRQDAAGPVTINETIVVALAIGVTATLLGGPLLAGAALMPLLFGVIVYRTRQLPGWSPSYLYVLSVLAPAAGFAAGAGDVASLPIEFLAFVLVPLLGALGLPLRATIRKRFGR